MLDWNELIPDLLILIAGLLVCFNGYKFFRLSLGLIGGIVGFYIGGKIFGLVGGALGLSDNLIAYWGFRGVFAIALGGLAFGLYLKALVAVSTIAIGYWVATNLLMSSGKTDIGSRIVTWLIGLAIGFAVGLTVYYVQKWTISLFTAIAGAKLAVGAFVPYIVLIDIVKVSAQKLADALFGGNVINGVSALSVILLVILATAGFLKQIKKV